MIKQNIQQLRVAFATLWAVALLIVGLYETDIFTDGILTGHSTAQFYLETLAFFLSIAGVYFALKLFSLKRIKELIHQPDEMGIHNYFNFSLLRLAFLAIPLWLDILIYYWTMNNNGIMLALITAVGTSFCWPSEGKLIQETSDEKKTSNMSQKNDKADDETHDKKSQS
jgi:hypothetical protein